MKKFDDPESEKNIPAKIPSMVNTEIFLTFSQEQMVEQIHTYLDLGLIDEAIAKQRRLPPPATEEQASVYARLRVDIAERLSAQGHAAGVFDLLQPYDTALSRV